MTNIITINGNSFKEPKKEHIEKYEEEFRLKFKDEISRLDDIKLRGKDTSPIDRLILYLREEHFIFKNSKKAESNIDKSLFYSLLTLPYINLISSTALKIKYMYRIANLEAIYYHNTPLLLENPNLISVSLFIMSFEEWQKLFIRDIKNTHLSGTDARSITDMVQACLIDGLERANLKYLNCYYGGSNNDHKLEISDVIKWIRDEANIYELVKDKDFSIKKFDQNIVDLKINKNSKKLLLSPNYKQPEILMLFKSLPKDWIPNIDIENFINKKTTYKEPRENSYYLKDNDTSFRKIEFKEQDKQELENFISFIGFLKKEKIILSGQLHIAKVIMSCLKSPVWKETSIKNRLHIALPNSIRKELIYQLTK